MTDMQTRKYFSRNVYMLIFYKKLMSINNTNNSIMIIWCMLIFYKKLMSINNTNNSIMIIWCMLIFYKKLMSINNTNNSIMIIWCKQKITIEISKRHFDHWWSFFFSPFFFLLEIMMMRLCACWFSRSLIDNPASRARNHRISIWFISASHQLPFIFNASSWQCLLSFYTLIVNRALPYVATFPRSFHTFSAPIIVTFVNAHYNV